MIQIVVMVCRLGQPDLCEEQRLQFAWQGSLRQCATAAQLYIAQWIGEHPQWTVRNYHCEYPGLHDRAEWVARPPAFDAFGATTPNGVPTMRTVATIFGLGAAICAAAATSPLRADDLNDYPTTARVDYVFGCMKANGDTRRALEQCSCSIDVIATILPYERYVAAETVLSMAQVRGALGNQFRSTEYAKAAVDDLRRAQAEAEVRCF